MLAKLTILTAALVAVTGLALADRPHHGPPPEARDACKAKAAGDSCSFKHGEHDVDGTCEAPPDGGELACRPAAPPPPPQEAIDACANRKRGDSCSFAIEGDKLSGTCDAPPDRPLACRPEPGPH